MLNQDDHASLDARFDAIFDQMPIAVSVYDHTGLQVASNAATATLLNIRREDWVGQFNMVTDKQLSAQGSAVLHQRVMAGETIVLPPHPFHVKDHTRPDDAGLHYWLEAMYAPLRDDAGNVTHLIAILKDVTQEIQQKAIIREAEDEITRQKATIARLSSPVVQVWAGILTVPLIGPIDNERAAMITENLLYAIGRYQAQCVILDITGVPVVDTVVAHHLIQASYACRLLGCAVALVGVSIEIAQTLVQLGIDLRSFVTLADLQAGIAWAFTLLKLQVVPAERAVSGASSKR